MTATHQTVKAGVWLLAFTLSSLGQNTRPDFTGLWRSMSVTPGSVASSITEVRQTQFTLELRPVLQNRPATVWSVYPLDGSVLKTKMGRHLVERTGYWEGNRLILRVTGPGNAPWRRNTEQQVLSLSGDGRRMRMEFHNLSDGKSVHDYVMESERVKD